MRAVTVAWGDADGDAHGAGAAEAGAATNRVQNPAERAAGSAAFRRGRIGVALRALGERAAFRAARA